MFGSFSFDEVMKNLTGVDDDDDDDVDDDDDDVDDDEFDRS